MRPPPWDREITAETVSLMVPPWELRGLLASFPGSSAWTERKEPGTHCLRMLSSPRISENLEISVKSARYTNLRKVCRLLPYKRCLSLTMLCVDDNEGGRGHSALRVQEFSTRSWIPTKHCSTWLTHLFLWSSPIASNEAMQTVTVEAILFLT